MSDFNEFERGALWALELLRRQLEDRGKAVRALYDASGKSGTAVMLNGAANLISEVRTTFELEFLQTVRAASRKKGEP